MAISLGDGSLSPAQWNLWDGFKRSLSKEPRRLNHGAPLSLVVAAHEWSLLAPLLLKDRSDFKAIPGIAVDPYIHQVNAAVAFFRRLSPRGLIADDVGLGKTITAGLIIRELLQRKKIEKFLVIAPKLILEQWKEELQAKFGLEASVVVGADLHDVAGVRNVITTYHSATRHMDDLVGARFDLLVLDEIHKLRNLHTTAPKMAKAIYAAQNTGAFRFALGLSATPLQNSLWDLYSIADILRTPQPNPYGQKGQFVETYVADPPVGRQLKPHSRDEFRRRTSEYMHRTSRRQAQLQFPDRVVHIESVTPSAEEAALLSAALGLLFENEVPVFARISMSQTLLSSPKAALAAIEGKDHGVGALLAPLRERFAALKTSAKLERLLKLIKEYSHREPDWRIIVFTIRRATAEFIREALLREGYGDVLGVVMGGRGESNVAAVADFVASPPRRRVLVSTDSGAEGVNLQACNVLINFDLPWNPMVLEQRIGRIQRLGQKAEKVIVQNLVTRGSVEESVVSRLFQKLQLYDATIGLAEEILGQLQEGEESIEELILGLVEQALKRRDVEKMLREQEENAKQAKEELERQQKEMDTVLGSTEGVNGPTMPDIQPAHPSLELEPFWRLGMKHSGWALRERDEGGILVAERFGRRTRRFTFDPDQAGRHGEILGAPGVELVAPDERAFEEVVTEWRLTGLDATRHHELSPAADLGEELRRVLEHRNVIVHATALRRRTATGTLEAVLRVNASVFHDQFEKVIRTSAVKTRVVDLADGQALSGALASPPVVDTALAQARQAAESDPDVAAFERFYLARKAEERSRLERARGNVAAAVLARAEKDIEERFTPMVEATLVAWDGELTESGEILVDLELPGGDRVKGALRVCGSESLEESLAAVVGPGERPAICHGGHLIAETALRPCSEPGCVREVCPSCGNAPACGDCGARLCAEHAVLCAGCKAGLCPAHRIELTDGRKACGRCVGRCAVSGAVALAAELVRCTDTGEAVLPEHAVKSAVSGRWIRAANAVQSEVSGAPALPEELQTCSASGKKALPSEVVTLTASGRLVLKSLAECCADTGEWVMAGELQSCALCNKRVLPARLRACDVSGDLCHPDELEACAETGKRVKPSLLGTSAVSGRRVLQSSMLPCSVTGELALPAELVRSEVSGRLALPRCTAKCAVTGKTAFPSEMEASSVSGTLALPEALLACEETGRRALPDEFGFCCVTGKRVLKDLLVTSARSGRTALKAHTGTCAASGRILLLSEMAACAVTGRLADPARMERSAISGAPALPSVMVASALSGRRVLPSETETCADTGRLLASDEIVTCEFTGAKVGRDQVVASAASGKVGRRSIMLRSDVPAGGPAGPGELVDTVTGKHVLPAEAEDCPACGHKARLSADDLGERFVCPSCGQVVCVKDKRGSRCSICSAAFASAPSASATPLLEQAFPKAREWRRAGGSAFEVAIGRPAAWALLTHARLLVVKNGQVVFSRDVRKGDEP